MNHEQYMRRALELARYRGSGRAVIAVDDAMLPENSGAFRVEFEDGKALSVQPTTDAPDAELPIGAFSAALMGELNMPVDGRHEVTMPGMMYS